MGYVLDANLLRPQPMDQVVKTDYAFKDLFESLPGMLYRCSAEGILTFVSAACGPLIGYDKNELEGKPVDLFLSLIDPEYRSERLAVVQQYLRLQGGSCEYKITTRAGDEKMLREFFNHCFTEAGELLYTEGLIIEIAEEGGSIPPAQDKPERMPLQDQPGRLNPDPLLDINAAEQNFFWNIIDNINVDIAVLDRENKYRLVNKAAIQNPDLRKWIIGKNDFEYCDLKGKNREIARSRTKMYELVDKLNMPLDWIEELSDENGNKRFFTRMIKPFHSNGNKYKIGYGLDITGLKVVQEELSRREHLLSFSNKVAKVGYWVHYPRNGKSEWSDGVYEILGIEKKYLQPLSTFTTFVYADDLARVEEYYKDLRENPGHSSIEFRIVTGSGELKYIKEQASFNSSDTEVYFFGVVQDITETKQHLQEREHLIKDISSKYRELMQFNYIISHNLRSPVANILGMASIFNMDLTPQEKDQLFEDILKSVESIDTVIKDLNNVLSTSSALSEKKEDLNIAEVIRQACIHLKDSISKTKASVIIDIDPDASVFNSVKTYVQSIFYNLISNAIKYRDPGRMPEIRISIKREQSKYKIEIADNGIGIDLRTHKNQLFGLYKRFNIHTEGKGLGLHMTKAQIESLGGTISVESEIGKGTTFKIEFTS